MNRRGDIPVAVLPLFALILCMGAYFAFITFDNNINNYEKSLDQFVSSMSEYDRMVPFVIKVSMKSAIISNPLQGNIWDSGNAEKVKRSFMAKVAEYESYFRQEIRGDFFDKIKNGDFSIEKSKDDRYTFVIGGMTVTFVEKKDGKVVNSIARNAQPISMSFDKNGDLISAGN